MANFRERRFRAGMDIVREGTMSGMGFFVVTAGEAAVSVSGNEVKILGPGDHFGELALISEQVRSATVTATTPLRCLSMATWHFRRFVKDNPGTAWKLLQHVVRELTAEQRSGPDAFPAAR